MTATSPLTVHQLSHRPRGLGYWAITVDPMSLSLPRMALPKTTGKPDA